MEPSTLAVLIAEVGLLVTILSLLAAGIRWLVGQGQRITQTELRLQSLEKDMAEQKSLAQKADTTVDGLADRLSRLEVEMQNLKAGQAEIKSLIMQLLAQQD